MAATDPQHLTAWHALATLAPLIGAGGVTSIILAVIGYMKGAREPRPSASLDTPTQIGIATLYSDTAAVHQAGAAIDRLASVVERAADQLGRKCGDVEDKIEKGIDEIRELRRAIEDIPRRG